MANQVLARAEVSSEAELENNLHLNSNSSCWQIYFFEAVELLKDSSFKSNRREGKGRREKEKSLSHVFMYSLYRVIWHILWGDSSLPVPYKATLSSK